MKSIKIQRNGTVINFTEEGKKFIRESRLTAGTGYTTTEWIKFQNERWFLLVDLQTSDAEKMKFLLMGTNEQ